MAQAKVSQTLHNLEICGSLRLSKKEVIIMKLVFLLFCFLERRCVGEVTIPAGALTMYFNG